MTYRKVYIIVLNWNGTDDTIECIDSLLKVKYDNYQIILVDNNSEKENFNVLKQWCEKKIPLVLTYTQIEAEQGGITKTEKLLNNAESDKKLLLLKNDTNLGFAAGNNVAIKYILKKKEVENYTLLLNNDTVVEPSFLLPIIEFVDKNSKYAACTPQIRLYEPNYEIWNCGGKITWFGNRRYYYAGKKAKDTPQFGHKDIEFITGCALFFKPHITGALSEKFFFGEEDFEFSLRMKQRKLKMACVFNSIIYHKVGSSINIMATQKEKICLHYTMRLINLKTYQNKFRWFISLSIFLLYSFILIVYKKRMGLQYYITNWKNILYFVRNYNNINYSVFKEIYDIYKKK